MDKEQYVVIGAGGHAKVVMDSLLLNNKEIVGLTDISYGQKMTCMEYPVLGTDDYLAVLLEQGIYNAAMGIGHVGYPKIRNNVYANAKKLGFCFPILTHPSAVCASNIHVGEGTLIAANSVINPEVEIGELCIINTSTVIEHEAVIANGVHIAPHATILGGASVGENTFIGAGAVVLQGVHIGSDCIIGAGSVILHDVSDKCVVVGNPGREIKRR